MIIDDEPLVRIAIRSLVDWGKHNFDVGFEASNGKQALKLLVEKPEIDLVVTDINMPIMDGIEFLAELRKMEYNIPVIALSGYNDYNLLRQAFKLGVEDYILKSEMTPDSLLDTFIHVLSKHQKTINLDEKKETADQKIKDTKNHYLKDMLLKGGVEQYKYSFETLGIRLMKQSNIVVCQLLVDDYKKIIEKYTDYSLVMFMNSMVHSVEEVLKDRGKGEVVSVSPDEYLIILCFEGVSVAHIKGELNELLKSIRYVIQNYINITITIGVSEIRQGINQAKLCADEAKAYANLRFILGKGRNIFPEDASADSHNYNLDKIDKEGKILGALRVMDKEKLSQELEQIFESMYHLKLEQINQSYPFYMEIVFILGRYINEIGEERLRCYINESDFYERIITFETLEEINDYVKQIVFNLFEKLSSTVNTKRNRIILKAINFINQNYSDKELCLAKVSEHVELSASHLSTLFTKEVEMSFKDYLTGVRLEKAKELISKTNLKMYEISDQVGYANVEHFSRVFKKATGTSPNCFKSK
jgi:YesN/AraC family two-component response regulator